MFRGIIRRFSVIFVLSSLPTSLMAQDFTMPVDGSFVEGQVQTSGGIPPAYDFIWGLQSRGNNLAVCGAGFIRDGRLNDTVRTMLRTSEIDVGGQRYPIDLSFFTRLNRLSEVPNSTVTCRVQPIPVPSSPVSVDLIFGNVVWYN